MTPEEEARGLIAILESLIEELRMIENGKNYSTQLARANLEGVRYALGTEGKPDD